MKIAFIIYGSILTQTGGYIYDAKLVEYLQAHNVEVKIFSQSKKNFIQLIKNNFSTDFLNEICEFNPDVILQDAMNYISLLCFNKKLIKLGLPIISIIHLIQSNTVVFSPKKWLLKKIEQAYLKSVTAFIFNSTASKNSVVALIGEPCKYLIAYPGKDRLQHDVTPEIIAARCLSKPLMIIFIGNLTPNKGLHVLLEALAPIPRHRWQLSIVGSLHFDPKYSKMIIEKINYLKITNNVQILGALAIEQLQPLLVAHHLLVVPSYYESFGIVYAEAMGAGLPVIASKLGGATEIVSDTINGFLIKPRDSFALRASIQKLMKDRDLLRRMSHSSLCAYQSLPSWQETMARAYRFIASIKK